MGKENYLFGARFWFNLNCHTGRAYITNDFFEGEVNDQKVREAIEYFNETISPRKIKNLPPNFDFILALMGSEDIFNGKKERTIDFFGEEWERGSVNCYPWTFFGNTLYRKGYFREEIINDALYLLKTESDYREKVSLGSLFLSKGPNMDCLNSNFDFSEVNKKIGLMREIIDL